MSIAWKAAACIWRTLSDSLHAFPYFCPLRSLNWPTRLQIGKAHSPADEVMKSDKSQLQDPPAAARDGPVTMAPDDHPYCGIDSPSSLTPETEDGATEVTTPTTDDPLSSLKYPAVLVSSASDSERSSSDKPICAQRQNETARTWLSKRIKATILRLLRTAPILGLIALT